MELVTQSLVDAAVHCHIKVKSKEQEGVVSISRDRNRATNEEALARGFISNLEVIRIANNKHWPSPWALLERTQQMKCSSSS